MVGSRRFYHVDRDLIKVKACYFVLFSAIGCLFPFVPLYIKAVGISKDKAGIIMAVIPFLSFVVQPLIGFIADKCKRHKTVIVMSCIVSGLSFNSARFVSLRHNITWSAFTVEFNCTERDFHLIFDNNLTNDNSDISIANAQYFNVSLRNVTRLINSVQKLPSMYNYCYGTSNVTHHVENNSSKNISVFHFQFDNFNSNLNITDEFNGIICSTPTMYEGFLYSQCQDLLPEIQISTRSIVILSVLLIIGYLTNVSIISIMDGITYGVLGQKKKHKYGQQRLWGNVGLAIFAVLSGYLIDNVVVSSNMGGEFEIAFYGYGCFMIALVVLTICSSFDTDTNCKIKGRDTEEKTTIRLFFNHRVVVFFLVVLYLGFVAGPIEAFLYWFLEADLQNEHKIIPGLCKLSNCVSEILMFYFSSKIISRLGHLRCIYIAMVALSVRFISYSLLSNPWFALPIEFLNGVSFSLMWSAATLYANEIASAGRSSTVQSVLHGIHNGLGKGLGCIVTGQLYQNIGMRWVYRSSAIMTIAVFLCYLGLNVNVVKRNSSSEMNTLGENTIDKTQIVTDTSIELKTNLLQELENIDNKL